MQPMSPQMLAALAGANASSQDEQLAPVPPVPQAQEPAPPNALGNLGGLALLAASGNPMFQQFAAQMMMAQGEDQRRAQAQKDYQNFQMALQARQDTIGANEAVKTRNFERQLTRDQQKRADTQKAIDDAKAARNRAEDIARAEKHYQDERNLALADRADRRREQYLRTVKETRDQIFQFLQPSGVDPLKVFDAVKGDAGYQALMKNPKGQEEYFKRKLDMFNSMNGKGTIDSGLLAKYIQSQTAGMSDQEKASFAEDMKNIETLIPQQKVPTALKDFTPELQRSIIDVQSLIVRPAIENRPLTIEEQQRAHAAFTAMASSPEGRKFFDETVAPAVKKTFESYDISPDATDRLLRQVAAEAPDASQSQLELSVPRQQGQRLAPLSGDEGKRLAELTARSRKPKSDLTLAERDEMASLSRRKNLSGIAGFFRKIDQGAQEGMRKSAEFERKARGY